jgi:peroxiredoxin
MILFAALLVLTDAGGRKHDLADYRGKVVLVSFWATWCEPCKTELPTIERLRSALAGKPFAVLAVQMGGSARTAQDTASDLDLHFPLLLDRDSKVTNAWNVNVLPTTFLIGPDGTIALRHTGAADWSSGKWRRRVESLLPPR